MPVTIMITLTISLLIALTLTPAITSRLFRERMPGQEKIRGFKWLLRWIIENPFRSTLRKALNNPVVTLLIALLFLLGSLYMFKFVGVSFFPKAEQPNLMIQITTPEGTSINQTDRVAWHVEGVLDTTKEVRYYATNVGHGNPQIYYNVFPRRYDPRFAEIYVELYQYDPDRFAMLLERLRNEFKGYPGARIRVKEFEQGPPFEAPIQIFLTGRGA
jgi:multidrug efflux pump subunit AcrB